MPFCYGAVETHRQTYRETEIVWATERTRQTETDGENRETDKDRNRDEGQEQRDIIIE